jgi:hypothetical protein
MVSSIKGMFVEYFAKKLEELLFALTHLVWDCMPWHVKVLFALSLIFVSWKICKTVYWFGNRIYVNFGEFRHDVQWTAGQIHSYAVWMKRKVCQLYWQMVEAHVDRLMMQERRNRFRSPPPGRSRGSSRSPRSGRLSSPAPRRVRALPSPRRVRFGLAS